MKYLLGYKYVDGYGDSILDLADYEVFESAEDALQQARKDFDQDDALGTIIIYKVDIEMEITRE